MELAPAPRYSYDPVTQTYTLQTPEQASLARGLYDISGDVGLAPGDPGQPGAGGMLGALGLAGMAYGDILGGMMPGGTLATLGGQKAADIAIEQEAASDKDIAAKNAAGIPVASQIGFAGTTTTTDPGVISGLQGLAAANAAQNAQAVENAQAAQAAAAAAQAAQDVADFADVTDQEAGAAVGTTASAASTGGDSTSDGGGDSTSSDPGGMDEGDSTNAGDSDSDTYYKGGRVMNYQGGGYATPNPYIYSQPTMMASGGLAAAKQTKDAGRGQDTMLVHMTPGEVKGLQALAMAHGGSLTINPNTGLPEAGFLSSILPTVAGMALAPFTGGMSAALLVGAGYTAATGSLKKGLMAGLGAFGGANIASGLGAAGQVAPAGELATVATPSTSAATTLTPEMVGAPTNITPEMLDPSAVGRFNLQPTNALQQNFAQLGGPGAETVTMGGNQFQVFPTETGETVLSPMAGGQSYYVQPPAPPVIEGYGNARDALLARGEMTGGTAYTPPAPTAPARPTYAQMGKGFENVFDQGSVGEQARKAFGEKAGYGTLASAAAPLLTAEPEPAKKQPGYIRRYNLDVANRSELGSEYAPGSSYERQMMDYNFTPQTPVRYAASGGLANLASGGQTRFLSGGGDGMSDSIPANIAGKQEARLSDGEFIVPADVVSHLGNGSSKAGAKKLYKMMDRIRDARTGKKSQAPEVKAERYMPA